MRSVAAVVVGYLIFGGSAVVLFQASGIDSHGPSSLGFRVFGVAYGVVFAVAAGWVTAAIGTNSPMRDAGVVASIVAAAGVLSMLASPGEDAIWTQLFSITLFAPLILVGGYYKIRRRRKAETTTGL